MVNLLKSFGKVPEITPAKNCIYAPVSGQSIKISAVKDKLIAQELLGKGIAIVPDSDIIYAPIAGKVTVAPKTCHAVALESPDGIEVLVHIGINTVDLKGKYFKSFVTKGEDVKVGQKLIQFDRAKIQRAGYDIVTPVIITNSDDYEEISTIEEGYLNIMELIIRIQ